ncbi:hypothetical protein IFM46972_11458 [Aspergillus udagawae]|uniref:Uncharacterized protein n=1 Tax=Aspergillus udagawae TaxID=91492 RepID=A0A8H3XS90_9EURO|nr:hypothetical protein IFM46972_11458 [Aspergillus udagawae]
MDDVESISSGVETPRTQSTNNSNGFEADRVRLQQWFDLAARGMTDEDARAELVQMYDRLVELLREEHRRHERAHPVSVRGATAVAPDSNPLSSVLSAALKPYQKVSDLEPIPTYNGKYGKDAATKWLQRVNDYFQDERTLAQKIATNIKKVTVVKRRLTGQAKERWDAHKQKAERDPTATITTLDAFKRWIQDNFREIRRENKH